MSVEEILDLPNQPSSGTVTYEPLGGDGVVAPMAAYYVNNFAITGDASGGDASLEVNCDERFACLCALMSTAANGGSISAGVGCQLSMRHGDPPPGILNIGITRTGDYISPDNRSRVHWNPDPIFGPHQVSARWDNVNGANFLLDVVFYLFDKNVEQITPLPQLLACLPRSGSSIP